MKKWNEETAGVIKFITFTGFNFCIDYKLSLLWICWFCLFCSEKLFQVLAVLQICCSKHCYCHCGAILCGHKLVWLRPEAVSN